MNLALIVPDGIGVKNYLFSSFPSLFLSKPENKLILFCAFPKHSTIEALQQHYGERFVVVPMPTYREKFMGRLYREAISYARLCFFAKKLNNHTILEARARANYFTKKLFLFFAQNLVGGLFSKRYNAILKLESLNDKHLRGIDLSEHSALLKQYDVHAILSLHQRSEQNIPFYEAARRLSIHRFAVIYSWDNVAKARLYSIADTYMLWSDYMKRQMDLFYPELASQRMVITGTPQFSFYASEDWKPDLPSFCATWGIQPDRPLVLFSGSDFRTSPFDPELLRDTANAILSIPEDKRPQLIFRRTPADFSNRYDWVFKQFPFITSIDPIWVNEGTNWTTAIPDPQDIKNLRSLLELCTLVINVSSTMALDAAMFDKPCIYLAFSPAEAIAKGFDYEKEIHGEDHFKVMKELNAVEYIKKPELFGQLIADMIEKPDQHATGRKLYLASITNNISTAAPGNIIETIYKYN